ncbi:MAG: geranylgeranylglycerol-phosphate geranylgeranyltransferase [Desulfurococcales archaeon]|nr:geranylgeranylglycerol-phosphate geranylgeranyltransferase [Desulfurococcales archaeon]
MAKLRRKVRAYLQLVRLHNLVATAVSTLIGYLAVAVSLVNPSLNPAAPLSTVVLVAAGSYAINDYFDVEVDKVNKPYRPIPSGIVGRNEALVLSIILIVAGVSLATFSGPTSLTFASLNTILLILYSYRIKELGVPGNIVIGFGGAASIIYGGLALAEYVGVLDRVTSTYIPALYAFLLLLSREIVKTIEDYVADAVRNVRSLPRIIGPIKSAFTAVALLALVIVLSPLPYVLAGYGTTYLSLTAVTDCVIVYSMLKLISREFRSKPEIVAGRVRAYLKLAVFIGSLAFLTDLLIRFFATIHFST